MTNMRWQTQDPFLFCVHHIDKYPRGNAQLGPAASLAGRNIGQDFDGIDGWRMYHGDVVPGFPQHPHRGFETVTIVRSGYIDHSDSLGATARVGMGDVQWLTAGAGVVHSEMFPLLNQEGPNRLELFQIWLNLPSKDKLVDPYTSRCSGTKTSRAADQQVSRPSPIQVRADQPVRIEATDGPAEILLLQGRPIGEPVAQYGPFVMNTRSELERAFADYQRTQFGGWPFPVNAPVHPREEGRFARHADGRKERAPV